MSTQTVTVELRKSISLIIGSFSFSQRSHYMSDSRLVAVNAGNGWRRPKSTGQGAGGLSKTIGWLVRNKFELKSKTCHSEYSPPVKQAIEEKWFTCKTARLNRFELIEYKRESCS